MLEADLAANLPSDSERASAIVQQRLKQGGTDLQRRIGTAYQGIADAWSLGVTKVPAILVDRRYVVYGETDVARAVARIDQYRRTQP
ncbi:integrating conjugative element protein, PFL_4709 family [Bordetella hinzii]|nr:integrating conjugative element protein, PFL_4709 family [Bordetella hinzii]